VDSLGLNYAGDIEVGGSGEGDRVKSRTASGITISFPGVEFTDQTAVVTPYEAGLATLWAGTEGQVSATFWKSFVVGIDFDHMVMTLTEPGRFHHAGAGIEVPVKPIDKGYWSIPGTIELEDGRRVALDLAMDLGYNDQLQIDPRGPHRMAPPKRALEASLGFGVQGETRGHVGRVRAVEIGKYRLHDVLTGFVSPADTSDVTTEAMVGLGLFSHFNVVYDYPGRRMFLEPNRRFAESFEYDMSGIAMRRGQNGTRIVTRVQPGSPASEAGLLAGDAVTQVNGVPSSTYDYFALQDLFTKSGRRVTLTILRDGREKTVTLKLRRII
jgi:hypothetical protein